MFNNKKKLLWLVTMFQLINETKTDYLTNLPNRKAFDEDIIFRIDKLKKNKIPALQLIVIDLKNLKKINDNEGMEAGDKIIIKMALILANLTSQFERQAYRIGGDEFAILQNNFLQKDYFHMHSFCKAIAKVPHYTGWSWIKNNSDIQAAESKTIATKMFNDANKQIITLKSNT